MQLLQAAFKQNANQNTTDEQHDATHANTHAVKFKLTGANSSSGYLQGFQNPPA